ncbi:hypothetical protein B566_EDAN012370 [Ephemera danica]|nr:hypothetical protein B566_EDAN012370 [Ephemera danica]
MEQNNSTQLQENAPASVSSIMLSLSSEDEILDVFEDDSLACVTDNVDKNLENICRICTNTTSDDYIYIFGPESEENQLLVKMKQHLPIRLPRKGDQMPEKVCGLCMEKLNLCHSVAELSARSDSIIRKTLGLSNPGKKRKFGQPNAASSQKGSELQPENEEIPPNSEVGASSSSDAVRYSKRRKVLDSRKDTWTYAPHR